MDAELIERYRVEPESEAERAADVAISPADFSIGRTKLELICEEGKEVMVQTGVSVFIQGQDCIVGIYTAQGDLAVASVGTYLHTATGVIPIKYIRKHLEPDPTVGLRDGDNFFANEAIYGGIHNPDQLNIVPIFHDHRLIAWVAAASHETEVGAAEPGGYTLDARTRYEEGIKYPPVKLGEDFRFRSDALEVLLNHVRDRYMIESDIRARTAACLRVRERLLDLVARRGPAFFIRLLRMLTTYTAQAALRRVAQLDDGVYRHVVFFDVRGTREGLGRVGISLTKRGERIVVDLDGSSPPTNSYLNTFPHIVRAHLACVLSPFLFSDLPVGSGMLEPFEVRAPRGTCVNPPIDTAIGGAVHLCPLIVNGIWHCLAKLLYDSGYRGQCALPIGASLRSFRHGGVNQHGQFVTGGVVHLINGRGLGARAHGDGVDSAGFWHSGLADSLDAEHMESQQPFLFLARKVAQDQHGFGKHRGGTGTGVVLLLHGNREAYRFYSAPTVLRTTPDFGLFGGYSGAPCPSILVDAAMWNRRRQGVPLPASVHELLEHQWFREVGQAGLIPPVSLPEGAIAAVISASGGGYGDPLEREPQAVSQDLRQGLISAGVARTTYRVVLDPETGEADEPATETARRAERQDRLDRGRPYADFVRGWESMRPAEGGMAEYGPWPYAIRAQEAAE